MIRRPPTPTRTDTLFPLPSLFRSRSWTPAFAGERLGAGRMRASPCPRLLYDAGVTASSDAARALNARSALPLNCVTDAIENERGLIGRLFLRTSKWRRSEEHTSELQSLMRNSYAVFCLKTKKQLSYMYHRRNI